MRLVSLHALLGSAVSILSLPGSEATSAHQRLHKADLEFKHSHGHTPSRPVGKREAPCAFPADDPSLVAITPHEKNAGWAMSPDQECRPGSYCPIACKPGMVMAQWDPHSSYTYPESMNGGLYCDTDGKIRKPFRNRPYCVRGTGAVKAVNKCRSQMSWCQTVLPGNEAMLIPTLVETEAVIACPDSTYWGKTAAHFYVNPPGTGSEGCIWGDSSSPIGNWSPFVAGANTDEKGQTFVKIGWNPIWQSSNLKSESPGFGLKVECPGGGCVGLPCEINPSMGQGSVQSKLAAVGAGGSSFCVVTVPEGKTAHIVAFHGSGAGDAGQGAFNSSQSSEEETPTSRPSKTQKPTTTNSTSTAPTTSSSTSTTSTTSTMSTFSSSSITTIWTTVWTSTWQMPSSSIRPSSTTSIKKPWPTLMPGIFHENGTRSANSSRDDKGSVASSRPSAQPTLNSTPLTPGKTAEAGRQQGSVSVAGLIATFVAAICLL